MARDNGNNLDDLSEEIPPRELTLGTSTLLGLFFALALVCAAFFGFGYSVGRKSTPATEANPNAPVADTYKPPAGSPAIQPVPGYLSAQQAAEANKTGSDSQVYAPPSPATPTAKAPSAATNQPSPAAAAPATTPAPAAKSGPSNSNPAPAVVPPTAAAPTQPQALIVTNNYVQIAAVSRQDDADLLLQALRSRGYAVSARPEADKLIHVQMGPFTTRKDADAMRERLLADGYNAIVK